MPAKEFDVIIHGATGYTGRLVAARLAGRAGAGLRWAMAGRSIQKLEAVRDEIGAPDTPLVIADAQDPAALLALVARTRSVVSTVGPYQLHGSPLVAACAEMGTDYLDLCGEPNWMRAMIDAHEVQAKASGARILFSCGFDSVPFELGVLFCQGEARARLGQPARRVKGRIRALQGGISGGTAASGAATMAALGADPVQIRVMMSPFALTPGFEGPPQPPGMVAEDDPDVGPVAPFMMAVVNTKNVHRSNFLMGHPYGRDFVYDEMAMVGSGGPADFATAAAGPKPGEGPTADERESGFYDLLFIGLGADERQVRVAVRGDRDPGYGSTSKIIVEAALALLDAPETPAGIWTPGAALQRPLLDRLALHAGLTFTVEA
jgi:short subunit dehydrogenase-like uncharacterized protein